MSVFELPTVTLIPNGIHHPPIEDGRLLPNSVKFLANRDFYEAPHKSEYGSLDMYRILKTMYDNGFNEYIRPDHGRMIWNETGRPGYGLYDRALGAVYLNGLWEAIEKGNKSKDN